MKRSLGKKITFIIAIILMISIYTNLNTTFARAASPSFTKKSVVIKGEGETYQLKIKNTVRGSKYKWSSTDRTIAIVTNGGLVTSVDKGSVLIQCKITYPSKKTKTLLCAVTVRIPADDIIIDNEAESNGSHTLMIGESYKFTYKMLPVNTSDQVYWSLGEGDKDCIKFDESGNVTGIKAGKVVLVATAASSSNSKSIVNDAEIIEVVNPSASVKSAQITGDNTIQVVFESPIDAATVIGMNSKLTDNITITPKKNTSNVLASDPGTLTASLSTDLKTLTITTSKSLEGYYGIQFTNNIKTSSGTPVEEYYKVVTYIDTSAPAIASVNLDDSGMITKVKFTKAISTKNMRITNVQLANAVNLANYSPSTISVISNKANYVLSSDKRTLSINMSSIAYSDFGKVFTVTLSGITDLQGTAMETSKQTINLATDITKKPQAQPLTVTRTAYNTLTATFNRAIETPGYITLNGTMINGVVDTDDNTKVNYTLPSYCTSLNGSQNVSIGYWNGYNVISTDNSAQQMRSFVVNFMVDVTLPTLVSYDYDSDTSILTLTYNKHVTLATPSGSFNAALSTANGNPNGNYNGNPNGNYNGYPNGNYNGNYNTEYITYAQIASTDDKVIKLQINNLTLLGTYSFTLPLGFALDDYQNSSQYSQITITNSNGTNAELPGPYSIYQPVGTNNQIYLQFANRLDVASAQDINNYSISGVTILSAVLMKNTTEEGATVALTIATNTVDSTSERSISISGVMGYNGSYSEITSFTSSILLADSVRPSLVSTTFDTNSKRVICLNFNEQIKGNMSVSVYQSGSAVVYPCSVSVVGNIVYINLDAIPPRGTYLRINVNSNYITDLSGNNATIPSSLGVGVNY